MENLGKTVSTFLKTPDLERLAKLKSKGVSLAVIVRRGIDEMEKEMVLR